MKLSPPTTILLKWTIRIAALAALYFGAGIIAGILIVLAEPILEFFSQPIPKYPTPRWMNVPLIACVLMVIAWFFAGLLRNELDFNRYKFLVILPVAFLAWANWLQYRFVRRRYRKA